MKHLIGLFLILTILQAPLQVAAMEYTVSAGSFYTRYESDEDDKGTQACAPVSLSAQGNEWAVNLSSSFRRSQAENDLGRDETLSGLSDTTARFTYERPGLFPFDLRFAMDVSLPTGKTGLSEQESSLFADADLFPFNAHGEGFAINPAIMAANSWGKWRAGVGAGYTLRGEYDLSEEVKQYDPGDIFLLTGEAGYGFSDSLEAGLYVEYGFFGKDKQDGSAYYQEGDFLVSGANLTMRSPKWELLLNLEKITRTGWIHEDEILAVPDPAPSSATLKNRGDEIKAQAVYRRFLTGLSSVRGVVEISRLDKNDRKESDPLYFGERRKFRSGVSFAHAFSPVTEGEIGVEMFLMDADKSYLHATDRTYTGVTLGATLIRRF